MAKKKWYVVIVGTSVGVFSNWLEVSPLITGVSGARHQSFPTKEEALEAFSVECAKGRVKVVDASSSSSSSDSSSIASSYTSSRTSRRRSQSFGNVTHSPPPSSVNIQRTNGRHDSHSSPAATVRTLSGLSNYPSNRSTSSKHSRTTSMSSRGTTTGRLSPLTLRSSTIERIREDTDLTPPNGRHDSHFSPAATVRTPSGLSSYPSSRSTTSEDLRTTSMSPKGATTDRLSPLTLRSSTIEHIRADTEVMPSNGRHDSHFSPAATVRTPSELSSYPSNRSTTSEDLRTTSMSPKGTTTDRLSPLTLRSSTIEHIMVDSDVNMTPSVSARSFRSPGGQLQVSISFPVPECANCSRNAQDSCEDALSNALSQMHVKHRTIGDKQVDPRSPMPGINYLPLSTNSAISFGRPSPSRTPRSDSALFRRHN